MLFYNTSFIGGQGGASGGGGLLVLGVALINENNVFEDNEDGREQWEKVVTRLTVFNCTFEGNSADYGGAIWLNFYDEVFIQQTIFRNNTSR